MPPVDAPAAPPAAPAPSAPPAAPILQTPTPPIAPSIDGPRKGGPAMSRMRENLGKIAKPVDAPPAAKPPVSKPPDAKPKAQESEDEPDLGKSNTPEGQPPAPAAEGDPKSAKPKANPWKVVDQWKTRYAELEKQLAESKDASVFAAEKKSLQERAEKAQKRLEELESEIYFVNYEKSSDFAEKYHQPYEKAWAAAMEEFKELTIEDVNTGSHRAVTPDDLLHLISLPIREARELANNLYGEFADDVMSHRKEIKKLFHNRQEALKEAREKGIARDKDRQQNMQKLHESIADQWQKSNEAVTKHEQYGPYLVPIEGDQEGNQRLAKGFEMVDRAMRENPMDPRLSAEERSRVIQRQAAIRNRAAAFGRMKLWIDNLKSENAELKKELGQYRSSEPNAGGSLNAPSVPASGSARERIMGQLRKLST